MIELSQFTVILVGELLLGFFLLSCFLIGYGIVKRNRIRKASRQLVGRIESDKATRTERLRSRLEEYYGYAGEALELAVNDLTQTELRLYQNVINSYLKQDVIAFQQSDVDVEKLVSAYQQLNMQGSVGETEQPAETSGEIKRLEEENQRLSEELKVTMDTMGHMLNEYSSMFEMSLQTKQGAQQHDGIQEKGIDQAEPAPEHERADEEGLEGILVETPLGSEADELQSEVVATGTESAQEIDLLDLDRDQDITVSDPVSADPEPDQEDGLDGNQELNQEPVLASVADLAQGGDSLMGELEPVDIDMPDAQVQLVESESPEGDSLEEEWAKLLEEDADSAESLDDAAIPQKIRAPEAP